MGTRAHTRMVGEDVISGKIVEQGESGSFEPLKLEVLLPIYTRQYLSEKWQHFKDQYIWRVSIYRMSVLNCKTFSIVVVEGIDSAGCVFR